jgi:hypothetical protein
MYGEGVTNFTDWLHFFEYDMSTEQQFSLWFRNPDIVQYSTEPSINVYECEQAF